MASSSSPRPQNVPAIKLGARLRRLREPDPARWRKSSYSDNGGSSCVEAGHVPGTILVRDTTDHGTGPVLRVTPAAWTRLTTAVRADAALS